MLLSKQYATRWPVLLGLLAMLVLAALAWHFYLERAAYYDLAWHTYVYTKTQALYVQNRRFVAIVTQWPTLMAVRLGLPLDQVLRLYSMMFVSFYLAIFLACAYWLRNEAVALVVVLLFVLLSTRAFYWAQSEMPQTLVVLLLFYAGISRQAPIQLKFSTLALAALVPVIIFGYPIAIIPFLFLWSYDWLLNKRFRDKPYYGFLVLAFLMYGLRAMLIPAGSYEDTQMTFKPNLIRFFPHYLSLESFDIFRRLCARNFIALPISVVVLTVFYLRQRNWLATLRLGLVWAFVGGYAFITIVTRADYTEVTYLENLLLPLTIFIAVPLAMEVLPALERAGARGKWLAAGLVGLVLTVRLGVLWYQHIPYTAYQQWLRQLLAYTRQFPERKYLMYPDNVDPQTLRAGWPWWAIPSETMVLSARHSPDSVQTVRVDWSIDYLAEQGANPANFLEPFGVEPASTVSPVYFRFPQTPYRVINSNPPQDTVALNAYIKAHRGVQLALLDSLPTTIKAGEQTTIPVEVRVPEQLRPLHSGTRVDHPTLVRTVFFKPHDWPSDTAPVEVPLEVDVWQPWQQTLRIQAPQQPGQYTLDIGLISRNYRTWPVHLRRTITVTK
ncbi:hypothetical protein [Hymenobacter sp. UYP22]|uniref:hypothetical protein n=1 Tax=Hymenobacter sp. UYP22 TaxID=3156348 RepID=UPI00339254E9